MVDVPSPGRLPFSRRRHHHAGIRLIVTGQVGLDKGEFRVPHGLFIDNDDNIWLADHQTHQVTKHNENGDVLMELGTHGYAAITVTSTNEQGSLFNNPILQLATRDRRQD